MLYGLLFAGVSERLFLIEMKFLVLEICESVFEVGEIFFKVMVEWSIDFFFNEIDVECIEWEDALAIEVIDDEEFDYMFRMSEEMEVVCLFCVYEE